MTEFLGELILCYRSTDSSLCINKTSAFKKKGLHFTRADKENVKAEQSCLIVTAQRVEGTAHSWVCPLKISQSFSAVGFRLLQTQMQFQSLKT